MARVFSHQTILELAKYGSVPVINGLSDECHPCQAVADMLTIKEHFGTVSGLRIVFIGDANNVSRSLARASILSGSQLVLACPKNYAFTPADITGFGQAWGSSVIQVHDPADAVKGAHVLYSDVWTSMGQEAEKAERLRAFAGYQINDALITKAGNDVRIMHCLPAHRDEEITDSAVEHTRSIIFDQAENRLHAQKAILRIAMANDHAAVLTAAKAVSAR
jgi:ornithine carbamoyltransferase